MQSINFEDFDGEGALPHLKRLSAALTGAKRIVAITSAGISVSAGIPVSCLRKNEIDCFNCFY